MDKVLYYFVTLIESVLGIVGVRAFYEQPAYAVVQRLDRGVEIRVYAPRLALETDARGQGDGEAFGRLFRYITGANQAAGRISMTAPVEVGGRRLAMTVPVEQASGGTMRFFLPRAVVENGAPEPTEAGLRLVRVPEERIAALRFSGRITPELRAEKEDVVARVLAEAGLKAKEAPLFMGYDPPFAIPFLRRNEVAVRLHQARSFCSSGSSGRTSAGSGVFWAGLSAASDSFVITRSMGTAKGSCGSGAGGASAGGDPICVMVSSA